MNTPKFPKTRDEMFEFARRVVVTYEESQRQRKAEESLDEDIAPIIAKYLGYSIACALRYHTDCTKKGCECDCHKKESEP